MPFTAPSSLLQKRAQPSIRRGYKGWSGAIWCSSWTEKPEADTEAARHARRRHISKVKLSLHSAQNCSWRLLAPRSSSQTALSHGSESGWYTSILKLHEKIHTFFVPDHSVFLHTILSTNRSGGIMHNSAAWFPAKGPAQIPSGTYEIKMIKKK